MFLSIILLLNFPLSWAVSEIPASTYRVSAYSLGRIFDGIGGLSGGGATSKLLVAYPEPERSEILDLLFLPQYAASLHILKVEIGGDDQSSDGSEASHMHEIWDENYNRGYEWWLMKEAKKRNPFIQLAGLSWSWPGWLGNKNGPWRNVENTARYTVNWILGAKSHHNLTIDYIGIWNERPANFEYILTLRRMLDNHNLKEVKIVAPDETNDLGLFKSYYKNKTVWDAIYAYGVHYPGNIMSAAAVSSGKRLWASEDYSTFNDDVGAGCWARLMNRNYVFGHLTSTISWNLISSYYPGLPWYRNGLMNAMQPWSGHYEISNPIWITAHTTQFSKPGWSYLMHGAGVGNLTEGGTYVTLVDPTKTHMTIVIETLSHNHSICIRPKLYPYEVRPQKATFQLQGPFANLTHLYWWKTELNFDGSASAVFQKMPMIEVVEGKVTVDLKVDAVHTLTTLDNGQHLNASKIPHAAAFPLPYVETFDSYKQFEEPHYLAQQSGAWEVLKSDDVRRGMICRQTVLTTPTSWCTSEDGTLPLAIIGNQSWSDIQVSVDVRIPATNGTDSVFVGARTTYKSCDPASATGIFFHLHSNSTTYALTTDAAALNLFYIGNTDTAFTTNSWKKVTLTLQGVKVSVDLGNKKLVNKLAVPLKSRKRGFVSVGSSSFGLSDYDNLSILKP